MATFEDWRALVGPTIDKLVHSTPEGIAVQPLYTSAPVASPAVRAAAAKFGVCMRTDRRAVADDIAGGADALWIDAHDDAALAAARTVGLPVVVEVGTADPAGAFAWLSPTEHDVLAIDPIGAGAELVTPQLAALAALDTPLRIARASTVAFHQAGADAADEIALSLSIGVAYLRVLASARSLSLQVAVGRDTFGELCKLRALRVCWSRLLAAAGSTDALPLIHAVCSPRTQSRRDPWVNMLRVSTEVFAAALGGADLITPLPFDSAFGATTPHARRVARNTALVLREESHLGRVIDAAGGSYYFETRTDELARIAWSRFQQLERDGGIVAQLESGALAERFATSWATRAAAINKRKEPVLGVSEFANLAEQLPHALPPTTPAHRDAEAFEALRAELEGRFEIALVQLGTPAEARARNGFATALFATAGLRTKELAVADAHGRAVACLCGGDDNYAAHAVAIATELRAAGTRKLALAGRPGALEAALRAAGVETFIYVGCDVIAAIRGLVP